MTTHASSLDQSDAYAGRADASSDAGIVDASTGQSQSAQCQEGYREGASARESGTMSEPNVQCQGIDSREEDGTLRGRIGCFRWFVRWSEKWPRLFAIIFKVTIPLLSLIVLSMGFGYWLAQIEAPGEIHKNNLAIASRESIFYASQFERLALRLGPLFCLKLSIGEKTGQLTEDNVDDQIMNVLDAVYSLLYRQENISTAAFANETNDELLEELEEYNVTRINDIPRLSGFMARCGAKVDDLLANSSVLAVTERMSEFNVGDFGITFNWIKCPSRRNATDSKDGSWDSIVDTFRVEQRGQQEAIVRARWRDRHSELFAEYYASYRQSNMTRSEARDKAIGDAFLNADGFDGCIPDTISSAWFWFTVMTTIGYGNASPTSMGGRAMVFTFGFLCILVFGVVLATAGDILTTTFQELISRHRRLKFLSRLWVSVVLWGSLFFVYLCVLSAATVAWKRNRVDDMMLFSDAYWFSFISITTVGLGDFVFEHEAIGAEDVVGFAILFLIGFVVLAIFLTDLRALLKKVGSQRNRNEVDGSPPDQG